MLAFLNIKGVISAVILTLFSLLLIANVARADLPSSQFGRVSLQGHILTPSCVVPGSERVVDIGLISANGVANDTARRHHFVLHLVGCSLERDDEINHPEYEAAFDGEPAKNGLFRIMGASELGLQINDATENTVSPVIVPSSQGAWKSGAIAMNYNLRVVGNMSRHKPDVLRSTVLYKISYF